MRSVQKVKAHQEECITRITCKNELFIYTGSVKSFLFVLELLKQTLVVEKKIHC